MHCEAKNRYNLAKLIDFPRGKARAYGRALDALTCADDGADMLDLLY